MADKCDKQIKDDENQTKTNDKNNRVFYLFLH